LLGLAQIAGKLGISAEKDILGFVRAADKINVALGEDLGDVETVMREMGKLTSTFQIKEKEGKNLEDALLAVGSAVNTLGASSTASESNMVDFAKRMGGIAPLAGISLQNILGLGAALDSMGQTSEVSATALSQLFIKMSEKREVFAQFAKDADGNAMSVQAFSELIQTDMNAAFIALLNGVRDNSDGMIALSSTLDKMGVEGGRTIGVLGTLANNIGVLEKQQAIANKSFSEGTSILDEFNTKNETFGAKVAKLQKALAGIFVNSAIMAGLESMVDWMNELIKIPLSETLEEERLELNKMEVQLLSANTKGEERVKIIKELQSRYPAYLGHLDADTVGNEQLRSALKAVNAQLVNKIILQKEDEKIEEQNRLIADLKIKKMEAEDELREKMARGMEQFQKIQEKNRALMRSIGAEEFQFDPEKTEYENAKDLLTVLDDINQARAQERNQRLKKEMPEVENLRSLVSALDGYYEAQTALNVANGENNALLQAREALMKRLSDETQEDRKKAGMDYYMGQEWGQTPAENEDDGDDAGGGLPPPTVDPNEAARLLAERQAAYDQLLQQWRDLQEQVNAEFFEAKNQRLEGDEAELAAIDDKFQKMLDQNLAYQVEALDNEKLTEQQRLELRQDFALQEIALMEAWEAAKDAKRKEFADRDAQAQAEAQAKIDEALASEHELRIMEINAHYQELLDLADQFGLDKTQIELAHAEALKNARAELAEAELEEERARWEARARMFSSFGQLAGAMLDFMGEAGQEQNAFQKGLVLAQIAMDTAAAISSLTAASQANPANAVTFGAAGVAQFVTGLAQILGNIARAKKVLSSASRPQKPTVEVPDDAEYFYAGGFTGSGALTEPAGIVHRGEYVVPNHLLSQPAVADMVGIIEAMRQGKPQFREGGSVGHAPTMTDTLNFSPLLDELRQLRAVVDAWPKQVRAMLTWQDWEDMQEDQQILDEASDL
jgi:TP901 family phage tail tape measure protein